MPCAQVYHVRNKMDSVGLDMLLDIHGDEELPYNFINGNEVCSVNILLPMAAFLQASICCLLCWLSLGGYSVAVDMLYATKTAVHVCLSHVHVTLLPATAC